MSITLTLPLPPSANRYWRNVKGRTLKSREARDYALQVGWLCRGADITPITGDVSIEMMIYFPDKRGDLSNRIKVAEDALNGHVYADDKQVKRILAERHIDKQNPRIELRVMEITE